MSCPPVASCSSYSITVLSGLFSIIIIITVTMTCVWPYFNRHTSLTDDQPLQTNHNNKTFTKHNTMAISPHETAQQMCLTQRLNVITATESWKEPPRLSGHKTNTWLGRRETEPLGAVSSDGPTVPWINGRMMIGKGNRSARRSICIAQELNLGFSGEKQANNRSSCDSAN